ncbi:MAG: NYN domain-containing protein [Candidatus Thiodiazotropha sp. (ex Lucina pensylvanica)]|nr:NYN domain-containing protein [Candidatus Thiodiazotropha sp. (ex Lucina pensylvanica)]
MSNTYLFVDGSSLLGDLHRLRQKKPDLKGRKLDLLKFCNHFVHGPYQAFVGEGYKRFSIYFVKGENRLTEHIILPKFTTPDIVEDVHIRYCGKRLQGSKKLQDWMNNENPPQYVLDRFGKSEKAVDTQICCDALQLASNNRLDRLFIYTNDFDFMPLFDTLKSMGANISLFRLTKDKVNKALVENADSFHVPKAEALEAMFEKKT